MIIQSTRALCAIKTYLFTTAIIELPPIINALIYAGLFNNDVPLRVSNLIK